MKHRLIKINIRILLHIILLIGALIMLFPFIWSLGASLKRSGEIYRSEISIIPIPPYYGNYLKAFRVIPLANGFLNSTKIAVIVTLGTLFTCSLAGYAFARIKFRVGTSFYYIAGHYDDASRGNFHTFIHNI